MNILKSYPLSYEYNFGSYLGHRRTISLSLAHECDADIT
jgi:hypothetical protein